MKRVLPDCVSLHYTGCPMPLESSNKTLWVLLPVLVMIAVAIVAVVFYMWNRKPKVQAAARSPQIMSNGCCVSLCCHEFETILGIFLPCSWRN